MPKMKTYLVCVWIAIQFAETNQTKDIFQDTAIEDFKQYCKYTALCFHEPSSSTLLTPCCRDCNCTEGCGYNCCPDKPNQFLSNEEVEMLRLRSCFDARYKYKFKVLWNKEDYYSMIGFCPNIYDDVITAERCKRTYDEFDFQEPMENFYPMFDHQESISYKNNYCAKCHGVSANGLKPWHMRLKCREPDQVVVQNFNDIPGILEARPDCHLRFEPPDDSAVTSCDYIERCNQTGEWSLYDPYLEIACLSYLSVFVQNQIEFRNVHCYLCNVPNNNIGIKKECADTYHNPDTIIYPFTTLLSFIIEAPIENTDDGCPEDLYREQSACVNRMCAEGMSLQPDGTCSVEFPLVQLGTIVIQINFRMMLKSESQSQVSFYELFEKLNTHVDSISDPLHADSPNICHISMDVVFKREKDTVYAQLSSDYFVNIWDHIKYLEAKIDVTVSSVYDIEYLDKYFLSDNTLTIADIEFYIIFQAVSTDNKYTYNLNQKVDAKESKVVETLKLSSLDKKMILKHGYDNNKGEFIIPYWIDASINDYCLNSTGHVELWPRPFTPRIKIDNKTKALQYYSYQSSTSYLTDRCPDVTAYNGIDILVCEDEYFSAFPEMTTIALEDFLKTDTILSNLSLFCISLSLFSLVLTISVYAVLPTLRTFPGLNNIGLVTSLLLYQTFYLISHSKVASVIPWFCLTSAVCVHFFFLAYAFWTLLATYFTTQVFNATCYRSNNRHILCKFVQNCVLVMILSSSFVVSNIIYNRYFTADGDFGYAASPCYIKTLSLKFFTVALPLGLVITVNIIMFIMTAVSFCRLPNMNSTSNQHFQRLKILIKLSSITGASWVFGFLHQLTIITVFAYFSILLNASTGVFIFVSFTVNGRVWSMLKQKYKIFKFVTHDQTKEST